MRGFFIKILPLTFWLKTVLSLRLRPELGISHIINKTLDKPENKGVFFCLIFLRIPVERLQRAFSGSE